jgi:hypothetical protein
MTETCPVVRVVSTHPETQGAFVEINTEDFNKEVHKLYEEKVVKLTPAEKKAAEAEEAKAKEEAEQVNLAALKEKLGRLGVKYSDDLGRADLEALLAGATNPHSEGWVQTAPTAEG